MRLKDQFRHIADVRRGDDGKFAFLLNDMVIEEQLCQMRCAYCLTEEFNLLMDVPDARLRLTTDQRADWHEVLRAYHQTIDCPILRLSGGEFFWLKGSTEFVRECSLRYETVQIITNGVFLNERRLRALAELGNAQLNISLDGHTLEMNHYRFPPRQHKLFDIIMRNLDNAVRMEIPIEIQCVLTDANAGEQLSFARFLHENYGDRVMLYFFPARGNTFNSFAPPPGDHLVPVVEHYDEVAEVLPPRAYVEHICGQLQTGKRALSCFVPGTMSQLFGQGDVSACPHAWIEPMGNTVTDLELMPREFAQHQHYELFMQDKPRFSFCKTCATPSDVINLYFLDQITDAEIERCKLYAGPRSLARLRELKSLYRPVIDATKPSR